MSRKEDGRVRRGCRLFGNLITTDNITEIKFEIFEPRTSATVVNPNFIRVRNGKSEVEIASGENPIIRLKVSDKENRLHGAIQLRT